ncbi:MAG: class I SAM-dependent methyltransferase [Candidatus Omnitrophota bacterium]|nr:class I SAM-dependent methyltransferase [Candidatus Omnitrophota bacterium]
MPIKKCRVCGNKFFKVPLLRYKNMPKAAQFLPDLKSLGSDKGINLELCQCSGCGLAQLNSEPVPYYRQVIRACGISNEMKSFRQRQFGSFVKDFSLKNKRIIEIGCGRGESLSIMNKFGVDAYGLEYSGESVAECVKSRLKVSKGFIQNSAAQLKYAPFEAFFILSFLEHLPEPNSTLRGIYNNLTDNAVGLIEVPNFDMILRKKLFSEFIGDHLFYFSKETLNALLKLNGFDVISCNEVWHDYIISAIVRKRIKLDISDFHKYQVQIKNGVEKYIRRFKGKKVAIWGAGHQALAVISLMDLAGKIRYVVDSAPFKQGKYTPATHIPIVSPDALESDPVDAVIVMAASYSDEVAGIIQQKYGRNIKVSILRDFGLEVV